MSTRGQVYAHRASKMRHLTEGQKGYIAGILDGEGHFYIRGEYEGACYSRIRVRITDEPVVKHLMKVTGVGSISSHMPSDRRRDGGVKKRIYEWQLGTRSEVRRLLTAVMPYLIVKKNRAGWILEFETLKDQGIGNGAEVRRLIDKIAAEQTHKPQRAGRDQLRVSVSKNKKHINIIVGADKRGAGKKVEF